MPVAVPVLLVPVPVPVPVTPLWWQVRRVPVRVRWLVGWPVAPRSESSLNREGLVALLLWPTLAVVGRMSKWRIQLSVTPFLGCLPVGPP